jgi:hypothetical protein
VRLDSHSTKTSWLSRTALHTKFVMQMRDQNTSPVAKSQLYSIDIDQGCDFKSHTIKELRALACKGKVSPYLQNILGGSMDPSRLSSRPSKVKVERACKATNSCIPMQSLMKSQVSCHNVQHQHQHPTQVALCPLTHSVLRTSRVHARDATIIDSDGTITV